MECKNEKIGPAGVGGKGGDRGSDAERVSAESFDRTAVNSPTPSGGWWGGVALEEDDKRERAAEGWCLHRLSGSANGCNGMPCPRKERITGQGRRRHQKGLHLCMRHV